MSAPNQDKKGEVQHIPSGGLGVIILQFINRAIAYRFLIEVDGTASGATFLLLVLVLVLVLILSTLFVGLVAHGCAPCTSCDVRNTYKHS